MSKKSIKPGDEFKSLNYGIFCIVDNKRWDNVLIRFPSGYEGAVTRQQVITGAVKDYFKRSYYGVGYIGGKKYKTKSNGKNTTCYNRWKNMLARCYDFETKKGRPSYDGCTVCGDWHNYQNYASWFYQNFISGFDVDKDIEINGNRVYSPKTCRFVSHKDNSIKANCKNYQLKSPDGVVFSIYNLKKFCEENNLTQSNVHKVINGERSHHKGWTI